MIYRRAENAIGSVKITIKRVTMNSLRRLVCCMLVVLVNTLAANAQLYDKLVKECYKMNSVFTDTGYQRFTVKYYFSTEKKPAIYTDSITASLKIHQGNYYGQFRTEEYMQNKQYLVTVFTSNGSIMVSNPVKRNTALVAIANLDSAFLANDIDSAWVTETSTARTIRFRFTNTSVFKDYSITYTKANYQVQKIVYALKQQMLNSADTVGMPANPLITIQFSGYSKTAFSDTVYDHNRYVIKDSTGNFKGRGSYSSYEVISTYQVPDTASSGFLQHHPVDHLGLPSAIPAMFDSRTPFNEQGRRPFPAICRSNRDCAAPTHNKINLYSIPQQDNQTI